MINPFRKLSSVRRVAGAHQKLSVGIACLAVLAAGTGIGVGVGDATSSAAPTTTTTTTPPASGKHSAKAKPVNGQIVTIKGNDWTIKTSKGKTFTVDISSSTQFGTKAKPVQESTFKIGNKVSVTGQRNGTTVDATRVKVSETTKSTSTQKTPPQKTTPSTSTP